ncbi:MAG: hypothetical protein ACREQ9_23645 [Candidatus Binatia bacterium]
MRAHRLFFTVLGVVLSLLALAGACGEPELNDRAKEAEGSGDPTGSSGSPAPGIPPQLPSGGVPGG